MEVSKYCDEYLCELRYLFITIIMSNLNKFCTICNHNLEKNVVTNQNRTIYHNVIYCSKFSKHAREYLKCFPSKMVDYFKNSYHLFR